MKRLYLSSSVSFIYNPPTLEPCHATIPYWECNEDPQTKRIAGLASLHLIILEFDSETRQRHIIVTLSTSGLSVESILMGKHLTQSFFVSYYIIMLNITFYMA